MKGEGTVDHSAIIRWFKKSCSGYKMLNNQERLGRPKTIDSEAMLQDKEANLANSNQRVSGELEISQSNVACQFHNLTQSIHSSKIVPHVNKILQNL